MLLPEISGDRVVARTFARRRIDVPSNRDLHAVILAAGRGSRLKGETNDVPKCLVEVGGCSLIEYQLRCFAEVGIHRILIVAGYHAHKVYEAVGDRAAVVYNRDWATTNSLYSLWFCRHWVSGPMIVLNCDVLADPEIVNRVLHSGGNVFAYDSSSGSADEHMKVRIVDGDLRAMSKSLPVEQSDGENVGLLYFKPAAVRLLFREAERVLGSHGREMWAAAAVEHVARRVSLRGVDISDLPWIEIDFPQDLATARRETWPIIRSRLGQAGAQETSGLIDPSEAAGAAVPVT